MDITAVMARDKRLTKALTKFVSVIDAETDDGPGKQEAIEMARRAMLAAMGAPAKAQPAGSDDDQLSIPDPDRGSLRNQVMGSPQNSVDHGYYSGA